MKGNWTRIIVLLLIVVLALLAIFLLQDHLSVDQVKAHKEQLLTFIRTHYVKAAFSFICIYLATALFLPGALALTVAGGMMFGIVPAMIYVNIAATAGATLAFLAARFMIGAWIQGRFKDQLNRLNQELAQHGHNYLLVLRILPVIPFFAVNYCAGITKIPLRTFVWTTSLGVLPGSLVYCFIGRELRTVNTPQDLFSGKIILALVLIALLALAPVILHHLQNRKE